MQKDNLKKMALAIFENLLRKFIKPKFILIHFYAKI